VLDEKLPDNAAVMGEVLLAGLRDIAARYPGTVTEVRGKGLLIGMAVTDRDIAALVIAGLAQQHILAAYILNNPCVIRFEPPLIVGREQIAQLLAALDHAIAGVVELLNS